jgi:hypothetical protein
MGKSFFFHFRKTPLDLANLFVDLDRSMKQFFKLFLFLLCLCTVAFASEYSESSDLELGLANDPFTAVQVADNQLSREIADDRPNISLIAALMLILAPMDLSLVGFFYILTKTQDYGLPLALALWLTFTFTGLTSLAFLFQNVAVRNLED